MAIADLARQGSGYAMAIILVALDEHGAMDITEGARNAISQHARQQLAAAQGEFFVVSASAHSPAAAQSGRGATGVVIVMLPGATSHELVQTSRGLLGEALA